jgi:Asp-tRNA(Asn)/Glu-tRNA(Gln) amidotransferase A subunit family amidase
MEPGVHCPRFERRLGGGVAAGRTYLALGTDIAGSIGIPASCCGIVSLKASFGRIPRVPAGNAFVLARER